MMRYYRYISPADLFALTSRGEGFGLPYSEAISMNVPILCPDKGGHLDFVNPDASFLVRSEFEPCHSFGHVFHSGMDWIETSVKDTRVQLRRAYTLWKESRADYDKLKENVSSKLVHFQPHVVGNQFIELFDQFV